MTEEVKNDEVIEETTHDEVVNEEIVEETLDEAEMPKAKGSEKGKDLNQNLLRQQTRQLMLQNQNKLLHRKLKQV